MKKDLIYSTFCIHSNNTSIKMPFFRAKQLTFCWLMVLRFFFRIKAPFFICLGTYLWKNGPQYVICINWTFMNTFLKASSFWKIGQAIPKPLLESFLALVEIATFFTSANGVLAFNHFTASNEVSSYLNTLANFC